MDYGLRLVYMLCAGVVGITKAWITARDFILCITSFQVATEYGVPWAVKCCLSEYMSWRIIIGLWLFVGCSMLLLNFLIGFLLADKQKLRLNLISRMLDTELTVGGLPEKFGWLPKHEREFLTCSSTKWERKETVIPSASSTSSKKSESIYTCPCAPFYRETKGLLHTDNTLGLGEYS
jgi:hypothetical protein